MSTSTRDADASISLGGDAGCCGVRAHTRVTRTVPNMTLTSARTEMHDLISPLASFPSFRVAKRTKFQATRSASDAEH